MSPYDIDRFGAQDLRLPLAFRFEHGRTLVAFGLHLPCHGIDEITRRADVLDLDAVHLDAPGRRRLIDHAKQAVVDLVALREKAVEVH